MSDLRVAPTDLDDAAAMPREDRALVARRVFRVLMPLAVLSLVVAGVMNWVSIRDMGDALPGPLLIAEGVPKPKGAGADVSKPAEKRLPTFIIAYETMSHQSIPGFGKRAAEAIYKTLNMDLESQVPTLVYARVELFATTEEATARLAELQRPYTVDKQNRKLNSVITKTGWLPSKGSYTIGWVRGTEMTYMKSSFADWIPATKHLLIKTQGEIVSDAVEVFERTGRQGVKK